MRDRALGPAALPENLALINLPMPSLDKLIGVWISHYMGITTRIVIFERGGKVWREERFTADQKDKGIESELVRAKQGKKFVFRIKHPHPADVEVDLHWVMTEDGSLEQHAEGQVDETLPIAKR